MMGDNEVAALIVFIITTGVTAISIARMWLRRPTGDRTLPGQVSERLTRIEQAIDAMSIEVERISEGQRFTTKLLVDRSGEPSKSALPADGERRG
jgi:hypothetical protein